MTSQSVIQGKYVLGSKSVVGDPRRKWEDRVFVGQVQRPNESSLIVGIVADGVGSAEFGARGAQLAIDTVLSSFQNSCGTDITELIEAAVESANSAVFHDNAKNDGDGLTTLVVAVIYNDRCFIGNVGDSRAYWLQQATKDKSGRVLQLTRDHNYYNIYGGDKNNLEANVVVNAIGKKAKVQVDCGFFLKKKDDEKDDLDKAYQLGLAGLPLKPGDTILLCSDGLIKSGPTGEAYIKPSEMIEAVQTEYAPNMAAIKMVSCAEGRRPDDNVSAVTIQYLPPKLVEDMKARSHQARFVKNAIRAGLALLAFFAFAVIIGLGVQVVHLTNQPTPTPILITNTPIPSRTMTPAVAPGEASVHEVNGGSASVTEGQILLPGTSIFSNEAGVRIAVGDSGGNTGIMYWYPNSAGTLDFDAFIMKPRLENGALYIQPGSGSAEVYFSKTDLVASVSGSRMIVEVKGNEIIVYCFDGKCRLGKDIPAGSSLVFDTITNQWSDAMPMSYDEQWVWSSSCNNCIVIVPSPTASSIPATPPVMKNLTPTRPNKTDESTNPPPTNPPPTSPPPTDPPPTSPPIKPPFDPPPPIDPPTG